MIIFNVETNDGLYGSVHVTDLDYLMKCDLDSSISVYINDEMVLYKKINIKFFDVECD